MAIFSIDSDAVTSATAAIRATSGRLEADTGAMMAQLTQLQASWTGGAAVAFQSVVERWRAAQREVETALTEIGAALDAAGQQYLHAEAAAAGMFR
ncbi:WXG100 family type VII secretion target [Microbacterium thalli]|uniref:ESAT-6-like protein n=1 Tax=Microbacterium thalli TaxID=3027921 RepID=A0ABT5SGK9_9MICO|nr:WXG100 family type VII secretion target [Microbacterium thalli]MDD7929326.1 WXG100 family type VII secretion target [Microbacterium thalli]MDD7961913.1 WXG100 family type VII secretion target [Microbacterium thalli]MDN8549150.1 WXG100 family type VII secretion target [Microbacterium thalli]